MYTFTSGDYVGSKVDSYKKTLQKRLFLQFMALSNSPGIFVLINVQAKKVYVGASRTPLSAAVNLMTELYSQKKTPHREMRRDKRQLSLDIVDYTSELKISKWEHMDTYIQMGYTLYNKETVPKYTARKYYNLKTKTVDIQVVSAGRRVKTVRSFRHDTDATRCLSSSTLWTLLKDTQRE